jgi:hypothetical protein
MGFLTLRAPSSSNLASVLGLVSSRLPKPCRRTIPTACPDPDPPLTVNPVDAARSCAIVGNSGMLRLTEFGRSIDSHDTVVRVNQAPTHGYSRRVGTKVTHRIFNRLWTRSYYSSQSKKKVRGIWNARVISSMHSARGMMHGTRRTTHRA